MSGQHNVVVGTQTLDDSPEEDCVQEDDASILSSKVISDGRHFDGIVEQSESMRKGDSFQGQVLGEQK